MNEKQELLDKIAREISKCKICQLNKNGKAVAGEGSMDAKVVFVGEAPGKVEALTGKPFVGRSGKLLRGLIKDVGLKEDEIFITSVVKYLPDYVTPKPQDILHGREHLLKQLEIIKPKIIVLLGSVAAQGVLGRKILISEEHGKVIDEENRKILIAYHPAAALRFFKNLKFLKRDFEVLKGLVSEL